jgi:putative DNA primase/helicase
MKRNNLYLSPEAIADGKKSGLSERDMRLLGMRSLTVDQMLEEYGVPGEGYTIPYSKDFSRAKILKRNSVFGEVHKQKYVQRKGTSPRLYMPEMGCIDWPAIRKNPSVSICITEGEKKAAAACKTGIPCVGVGGVSCFRSKEAALLPDFEQFELKGRTILIAYDSDLIDKPQVRYAEYMLCLELTVRGATVMRVRLPQQEGNDKVGLDDYLVANGLPRNIKLAKIAFDKLPIEKIDPALPPHLSELGNAIRFEQSYKEKLRFIAQKKKWLVYCVSTGLWSEDDNGEAMRCAKLLPYTLRKEARKLESSEAKDSILNWAKASESKRNLEATLSLASSEAGLIVSLKDLDNDIWRAAFKNGTSINLKTGIINSTAPEDFFTKSLGTSYNPMAKCPRWERFLHEVFNGNKELTRYVQRVVGMCLTGDMSEQCYFLLYGTGANGKSTFLSTLLALFGDYARQASPHTFIAQKSESGPRSDLVRLVGVRLIATSETDNYQRMAESLVKQWTGGEQIVTRDLYAKTFEFAPQGKILFASNHKPKIYSTDYSIWRRVQIIPFTRTFTENEKDPLLPNKLSSELSGILNWAIRGCLDWQENGLNPPSVVANAVNQYRTDMDVIGSWIEENCEVGTHTEEALPILYENYKRWAEDSKEHLFSKREFSQKLKDKQFTLMQTTRNRPVRHKAWYFLGIRLNRNLKQKY